MQTDDKCLVIVFRLDSKIAALVRPSSGCCVFYLC